MERASSHRTTNYQRTRTMKVVIIAAALLALLAPTTASICGIADIVFVADDSGSVLQSNWVQEKSFMKSLLGANWNDFSNVTGTCVGVIRFSSTVIVPPIDNLLNLGNHSAGLAGLQNEIDALPFAGSLTNTEAGVRAGYEMLAAGRLNVEKILVLITDGNWNAGINPCYNDNLKNDLASIGAKVFIIAVGGSVDLTKVDCLITDVPTADYIETLAWVDLSGAGVQTGSTICATLNDERR